MEKLQEILHNMSLGASDVLKDDWPNKVIDHFIEEYDYELHDLYKKYFEIGFDDSGNTVISIKEAYLGKESEIIKGFFDKEKELFYANTLSEDSDVSVFAKINFEITNILNNPLNWEDSNKIFRYSKNAVYYKNDVSEQIKSLLATDNYLPPANEEDSRILQSLQDSFSEGKFHPLKLLQILSSGGSVDIEKSLNDYLDKNESQHGDILAFDKNDKINKIEQNIIEKTAEFLAKDGNLSNRDMDYIINIGNYLANPTTNVTDKDSAKLAMENCFKNIITFDACKLDQLMDAIDYRLDKEELKTNINLPPLNSPCRKTGNER